MPQYVGLSQQEILKKIQSDTRDRISREIKRFADNADAMKLPERTLLRHGFSVSLHLSSELLRGYFGSAADFATSMLLILNRAYNDMGNVLASNSFGEGLEQLGVLATNLSVDLADASISGLAAVIGQTLRVPEALGADIDPDVILGEGGFIDTFNKAVDRTKANAIKGNWGGIVNPQNQSDFSRFSNFQEDLISDEDTIDNTYSEGTKRRSEDIANINTFVKKEIINRVIPNISQAPKYFDNERWFQTLEGVADSVGTIMGSWTVASMMKRGFSQEAAIASSKLYFASTVFAKSFVEAQERGASIDDAYKYAASLAAMETILENTEFLGSGGIKTSGFSKKLTESSFSALTKSMLQEGLEEVAAEFIQPAYERRLPDAPEKAKTNEEFLEDVFYAGAAGMLASAGIATGSIVFNNATIDAKQEKFKKKFNRAVEKGDPQRAVDTYKNTLNTIVKQFNKPKTRGYVKGRKGAPYIGRMDTKAKNEFLKKNGLEPFIEVNESGVYSLTQKGSDLSVDSLKNTLNGKSVEDGVYAHNEATMGIDLQDGRKGARRLNLSTVNDLSEFGRQAFDYVSDFTVPVLFYKGDNVDDGFVGNNGVIYINENALDRNYAQTIIKHEMGHIIATYDPELYQELQNVVDELVEITFDKENSYMPKVSYKNSEIANYLNSKGYAEQISTAFLDIYTRLKNSKSYQNKSTEELLGAAAYKVKGEIVPYLVESVIGDGILLNTLERKKPGIVERIQRHLEDNKRIQEINDDPYFTKRLKRVRKIYTEAGRRIGIARQRYEFYTDFVFGSNMDSVKKLFKPEYLEDYSAEEIMAALIDTFEPESGTFELGGEVFKLGEIINEDATLENLERKRISIPTLEEFRKGFDIGRSRTAFFELLQHYTPDPSKHHYIVSIISRLLKQFIKRSEIQLEHRKVSHKLRVEIDLAGDILNELNSKNAVEMSQTHQEFLLRLFIEQDIRDRYHELVDVTKKQIKDDREMEAEKWVKKYIYRLNKTAVDSEGRPIFMRIKNGGTVLHMFMHNNMPDFDKKSKAEKESYIENVMLPGLNIIMSIVAKKDTFITDIKWNLDMSIVDFLIMPSEETIDQAMERLEKDRERIQKIRNKWDETVADPETGITNRERYEYSKFYTSENSVEGVMGTLNKVLSEVDLDIKDFTLIEPSAGDGAFLNYFDIQDYTYEAYDIKPENDRIEQQDFLELNREYDENAIVVGNIPFTAPPFGSATARLFVDKALEIAPIFAAIVPVNFHTSGQVQLRFSQGKKLIHTEILGAEFMFGSKVSTQKSAFQIWVNESDPRFKKFEYLNKTKDDASAEKTKAFKTVVLNGQKKIFQNAKGKDFDFIVKSHGKHRDYNHLIYDFNDLIDFHGMTGHYIMIKAQDIKGVRTAEETLDILKSIDYEDLADQGSKFERGFSKRDLVKRFNAIVRAQEQNESTDDDTTQFRVSRTSTLDETERAIMNEALDDDFMSTIFEKNRKGEYVLRNRHITRNAQKLDAVRIGNKTYDSSQYAVHTAYDVSEAVMGPNAQHAEQDIIVPMERLRKFPNALRVFEFLKTTNINFVVFEGGTAQRAIYHGYSIPRNPTHTVFINLNSMNNSSPVVLNTLIHESWHEYFNYDATSAYKIVKDLFNVLFDSSGNPTKIFQLIDSTYPKGFVSYLNDGYHTNFKDSKELYDFVVHDKSRIRSATKKIDTINEVGAQMVGEIFCNARVYTEILKGTTLDMSLIMAAKNVIDQVLTDPNFMQEKFSSTLLKYFEKSLEDYRKAHTEMIADAMKRYPGKRRYTRKDINKFIKTFTEGEFTTQAQLIAQVLDEKAHHTRGKASIALDNMIYLLKQFSKTTQSATSNYRVLRDKFQRMGAKTEFFLSENAEILKVDALKKKYTEILKMFQSLIDKQDQRFLANEEGFAFDEIMLEKLEKKIKEFNTEYEHISDELVEFTGMPETSRMNQLADYLLTAIERLKTEVISDKTVFVDVKRSSAFSGFISHYEMAKKLNFFGETEVEISGIYAKMEKLQKSFRSSQVKVLLKAIETKLKNFKRELTSSDSRQKDSPLSDTLQEALSHLESIINVIKTTNYDYKKMHRNLLGPLIRLYQMVTKDEMRFDEATRTEYSEEIRENVLEQLDFLVDPKHSDKKKFSETKFAGTLIKALRLLKTQYRSILSDYSQTLDDYAGDIAEEMSQLKKNYPQFNVGGMNKVNDYFLNQDYFKMFVDYAKDKHFRFFSDFWNVYYDAVKRRSDILMEFVKRYANWNKENKELRMYSVEEMVEIPFTLLARMTPEELRQVTNKVDENLQKKKDEIKELENDKKDLQNRINDINTKLKHVEIYIKQAIRGSSEYHQHIHDRTVLRDEKSDVLSTKKTITDAIKRQKDNLKALDRVIETKTQVIDMFSDGYEAQYISHGELISLYLSVLREIELHELAEENPIDGLRPTDHFYFDNTIYFLDNIQAAKEGYGRARDSARSFKILAETREQLLEGLQEFLTAEDMKIIEFAKERFDVNYDYLDDVYFKKYQVHLPKQTTYIPYQTMESDLRREFTVDLTARENVGAFTGMVMETTLGAKLPLLMENIFNLIEVHTTRTANYSLDPLITDYQNLMVNTANKNVSLQAQLTGADSHFGAQNGIIRFTNRMLTNILRYSDLNETSIERLIRKSLRNVVAATMMINIPSTIRQFISTSNIWIKEGGNIFTYFKNIAMVMGKNNRFKQHLLDNNSNFFFRDQMYNNPNLAEQITASQAYKIRGVMMKLLDILGRPVSWADTIVLVGAFKSYYDSYRKNGKTDAEALDLADEKIYEVLLYGVANTDSAFRSHFSNSKSSVTRIFSKFQSENLIHISSLLRDYYLIKNRVKGAIPMFLRDLLAFMMSGFFSALVGIIHLRQKEYLDEDDDMVFEFFVNEFLWGNLVGAIPVINQFANTFEWSKDTVIKRGFDVQMPPVTEVARIGTILSSLSNGQNVERKILKVFEQAGQITGIPVKNFVRVSESISKIFAKKFYMADMYQFFTSKSDAEILNEAIKTGKKDAILANVKRSMDNATIQNEITRLLLEVDDAKISFYNVDTFRKMNDEGKYERHPISEAQQEQLKRDVKFTILKTLGTKEYRLLSKEERLKVIQRIINYHYNKTKATILGEEITTLDYDELVQHVLSYSK